MSTSSGAPQSRPTGVWPDRRVIAYAHQGGAWEAPSSTLHAIAGALEAGATGIELDVHATADHRLVVCHDATVDRTTVASGAIVSFHYEELARLDNAYWWAPGADVSPGLDDAAYPHRGRAPGKPAGSPSRTRSPALSPLWARKSDSRSGAIHDRRA